MPGPLSAWLPTQQQPLIWPGPSSVADDHTQAGKDERAQPLRPSITWWTPVAADRLVSSHDGDARPIIKGRNNKPVEFGYKAQIVDNEDGVVVDCTVEQGNPADGYRPLRLDTTRSS